ncbi:ABC transporter permease [Roseomonas fluvialis]|uniref:ABC transporter permease n=1 Tax=Roseomonas fluvialis TaxID=1750527 RepID=A0ABM7Y1Q6_9PROT|nr:ABC transporter permease [Roseomonas fluvialis]BDG71710.1 ABC transporter permease [Roseomonas fluvialis]
MRTARSLDWQLAAPLALFYVAFVFAPIGLLVAVSFAESPEFDTFSLHQYARVFGDAYQRGILADTLQIGAQTTAVTVLLAYPLALLHLRSGPTVRRLILLAILLPLLTSTVVRTFGWVVILGRQGLINTALLGAGLVEKPVQLLYTHNALVVALAQIELPLMALPIINALARIDPTLIDASATLGARRWRTFFKVVLPLSLPGLIAGMALVFAGSISAIITQTLVGGGRMLFMPYHLYQQAILANDWPFAAALAVILLAFVLMVVGSLLAFERSMARWRHAG